MSGKMYTPEEMRTRAKYEDKYGSPVVAGMLHQAADAEDELDRIRKRLDDVIEECQIMKWEHYSSGYPEDVVTNQNVTLDNVICVAMGEEVTNFSKCLGKKRESLVQLDELIAERDALKKRLEEGADNGK